MSALASYASHPEHSRGRLHTEARKTPETPALASTTRGPRDCFQRDRDRIIHSIAFRRLRHKTQVFVAPDGDHYRVRLTHSLEVAQIGRTIARALGLNEDLTEALCLAHDIGHPPFGHAGEDALQEALAAHGGFDHNAQTIRTLAKLETPYPRWDGLNLTWEMLEGLAKHNGPVANPPWALAEANAEMDLELRSYPSLEAQVAAISDDIAYDNHDIDDGLRAGLLTLEQLLELPLIHERWHAVQASFPDVATQRLVPELIRDQIGLMVNDVIETTTRRLKTLNITTAVDVRAASQMIAGFSPEMAAHERALKKFMYTNLYHHPDQLEIAEKARVTVTELITAYRNDPTLMPDDWRASLPPDEPDRIRHISDFLAGMTDRYASKSHAKIYGNKNGG